jgi:hypothetical protein
MQNKILICEELLDIISKQEEIIEKLVNENLEQENMINELMKSELD